MGELEGLGLELGGAVLRPNVFAAARTVPVAGVVELVGAVVDDVFVDDVVDDVVGDVVVLGIEEVVVWEEAVGGEVVVEVVGADVVLAEWA